MEQITLPEHEAHSQQRAAQVIQACTKEKEAMSHEGVQDKVDVHNIFKPGSGDGGGMGNAPWAAILPALASEHRGRDGWGAGGFGAGLVGGVLGGLLFGGRRGGIFGGGGDCDNGNGGAETRIESDIFNTAVLGKLGSIEASIPLASAQTENVILQQTNQITNLANQNALMNQSGFASTKDAVQNVGALILGAVGNVNQNVLEQACQTRAAIAASETAILQKIDANTIANLQAELLEARRREDVAARTVDLNQLRSSIEINNSATSTQAQGQQQFQVQAQFQDLNNKFARLFDMINIVHQEARATNQNIIAGNSGAGAITTGPQTASPTNVNTR